MASSDSKLWCFKLWCYRCYTNYVSPSVDRVGDILVYLCLLRVSASSGFYRAGGGRHSKHETLPNAGLILADSLRRWANISTVISYCVVFGDMLNVDQLHRRQANINPALLRIIVYATQAHQWPSNVLLWCALVRCRAIVYNSGQHLNGIGAVYAMCTHLHPHEVLARAEWILASTGDAGPTFNRHCVGVSLYSTPAVSTARPACYWMQCWQATLCFAHRHGSKTE